MLGKGTSSTGRSRQPLGPALAACLLVLSAGVMAETAPPREDRIKAALIFKLIKFVDWPAAALAGKDPLQICVLGDSPVGDALANVDGKPARDRLAQFRRVEALSLAETRSCHVLYIPAGTREIGGGVPAGLRGRSVLTVSDAPDFARRGGMIGLSRGENKMSFEINLRNARESGLEPGAPLLELATVVE
jgi:hypothetical protein